ncbi:hypothetical protein AB0L33_33590 [Streptomyces sp. NPDC052299]|uniref:hypothetical protein n=1 Tax=Streptomyces sp. NPDC052299 TaxID=3155054 RepID=UPI003421FDF7
MRGSTGTTVPAPKVRGLQAPAYGAPSPDLLARAERGLARFLARYIEDRAGRGRADSGEDSLR